MKASLKKYYKKGFFLTEENLIKINDIILKRTKEKEFSENIIYKLYRSDALVYESSEYNKIIQEENSKRNLIDRLEINFDNELFKLNLIFDKKENTSLKIEADDKDFAYLIFSDLKEYLTTEILKFRGFSFKDKQYERMIIPFFLIIFLMIIFLSLFKGLQYTDEQINEIISSDSLHLKLNYLVEKTHQTGKELRESPSPFYGFIIILIFTALIYIAPYFLEKIFPRNMFYFGKEILRYDNLCSIRGKIIWGIVIAFSVSVIAGFSVFYMTGP